MLNALNLFKTYGKIYYRIFYQVLRSFGKLLGFAKFVARDVQLRLLIREVEVMNFAIAHASVGLVIDFSLIDRVHLHAGPRNKLFQPFK